MQALYPYLSLPSVKEQTIADIANTESVRMCEGQLSGFIHIAWQVHVCTPNFTSSLSICKLANARRPVYLLALLVAKSEI